MLTLVLAAALAKTPPATLPAAEGAFAVSAFRQPFPSEVPALLVSGTWDGRTPPANADAVAATMAATRVVTIPRASHGLFQEPAAIDALRVFLRCEYSNCYK